MKTSIVEWMGRRFVILSCESRPEGPPAEQAQTVFSRIAEELSGLGLSLEQGVGTRRFASGLEARRVASDERIKALADRKRCASSSFIAPDYLDSAGIVAVDLVAMAQGNPASLKTTVEYDPPRCPASAYPWSIRCDDTRLLRQCVTWKRRRVASDLQRRIKALALPPKAVDASSPASSPPGTNVDLRLFLPTASSKPSRDLVAMALRQPSVAVERPWSTTRLATLPYYIRWERPRLLLRRSPAPQRASTCSVAELGGPPSATLSPGVRRQQCLLGQRHLRLFLPTASASSPLPT